MEKIIEVSHLQHKYGDFQAIQDLSFEVQHGEVFGLLGPNGAGKTTTLRSICGLLKPRQGNITLNGAEISHIPAHELVFKGVAMVPEGRGVFARLTVAENLDLGSYGTAARPGHDDSLAWVNARSSAGSAAGLRRGRDLGSEPHRQPPV